jgi:hypothetical protein
LSRENPESVRAILNLQLRSTSKGWNPTTGIEHQRNPELAARLAAFVLALSPEEPMSRNTLGVDPTALAGSRR